MKDTIRLSSLTVDALSKATGGDIYTTDSPEKMSWIYFLIKELDDTAEVFPRGKWATIQEIQGQLEAIAANYFKEAKDGTSKA